MALTPVSGVLDAAGEGAETWHLRLYVAGQTVRSLRAISNLRRICDAELDGRHEIEIVDLAEHPSRARLDSIVVLPTLVRRHPAPERRLIGDLSDTDAVLRGLGITP